jgi:hypothetical protein
MKLSMALAACVAGLACASAASATTINFSALAPGTAVTTQYSGLTFSLIGGTDAGGAPTTGYADYDLTRSLANSSNTATTAASSSGYPTADILDVAFAHGVSGLSFSFSNYGGIDSTYTAYGAGGVVISSGDLSSVENFALVNVAGSGITDLQINNNTDGSRDWIFGVGELSYTNATNAVPEPTTWAVLILGMAAIGFAARRRREGAALAA